jgi:hypothetical protein
MRKGDKSSVGSCASKFDGFVCRCPADTTGSNGISSEDVDFMKVLALRFVSSVEEVVDER